MSEYRKPWWQREPPPVTRPAALWLVAAIAVTAHYTHTKLNFSGAGGQDEPVTWWIAGFWTLLAVIASARYAQLRRRRDQPDENQAAEPPAEQDRSRQ
jgi:hypothetical protein